MNKFSQRSSMNWSPLLTSISCFSTPMQITLFKQLSVSPRYSLQLYLIRFLLRCRIYFHKLTKIYSYVAFWNQGRIRNCLVDVVESCKAISRNSPYSKRIYSHKLLKRWYVEWWYVNIHVVVLRWLCDCTHSAP